MPGISGLQWKDWLTVAKKLDQLGRDYTGAAARNAMNAYATAVLETAISLAPLKTGALRASGYKYTLEANDKRVRILVGFRAHYASYQHERLDYKHTIGQAKYLATAFSLINASDILFARLFKEIKVKVDKR